VIQDFDRQVDEVLQDQPRRRDVRRAARRAIFSAVTTADDADA
jgi:hypothetical protein